MKKPNVAYRALRYLKNHGLKETIERAKQGNEPAVPPKNNVIGFYRFVVDNDPIPFNQKEYEKHKTQHKQQGRMDVGITQAGYLKRNGQETNECGKEKSESFYIDKVTKKAHAPYD